VRKGGEAVSRGVTDERQGEGKTPGAAAYRWTGGVGVNEMQWWGVSFYRREH
jgi:hypothetical protein